MKTMQKVEPAWKHIQENYINFSDSAKYLNQKYKKIAFQAFAEVENEEFP